MKKLLIAIMLFSVAAAPAQVRKFKWSDDFCEYEGTYDTRKYSAKQLQDTSKLLGTGLPMESEHTPWKIEDLKSLSVATLDAEYRRKSAALKSLKVIKLRYWQKLRDAKVLELDQFYTLARLTVLSLQEPYSLRDYKGPEICLTNYGEPLIAGGDALLGAWTRVNMDSREKNSDPQRLERIFNQQMNSPDRLLYARVEVTTFGWWNCVNDSIKYIEEDGTQEKEFKKLFTKVRTIYCEEP